MSLGVIDEIAKNLLIPLFGILDDVAVEFFLLAAVQFGTLAGIRFHGCFDDSGHAIPLA